MKAVGRHILKSVGRVSFLVYVGEVINNQLHHSGGIHVWHDSDGKFTDHLARYHRLAAGTIKRTLDSCNNQKSAPRL